jgi:hypothetical protein
MGEHVSGQPVGSTMYGKRTPVIACRRCRGTGLKCDVSCTDEVYVYDDGVIVVFVRNEARRQGGLGVGSPAIDIAQVDCRTTNAQTEDGVEPL